MLLPFLLSKVAPYFPAQMDILYPIIMVTPSTISSSVHSWSGLNCQISFPLAIFAATVLVKCISSIRIAGVKINFPIPLITAHFPSLPINWFKEDKGINLLNTHKVAPASSNFTPSFHHNPSFQSRPFIKLSVTNMLPP